MFDNGSNVIISWYWSAHFLWSLWLDWCVFVAFLVKVTTDGSPTRWRRIVSHIPIYYILLLAEWSILLQKRGLPKNRVTGFYERLMMNWTSIFDLAKLFCEIYKKGYHLNMVGPIEKISMQAYLYSHTGSPIKISGWSGVWFSVRFPVFVLLMVISKKILCRKISFVILVLLHI